MALTKEYCEKLFHGYLINTEIPYRINLPRDLVFQLLTPDFIDITQVVDVEWYFEERYQTHPFSLFKEKNTEKSYLEQFNKWRETFLPKEKVTPDPQNKPSTFGEILEQSALTQMPIVIGENHSDLMPKLLLIHNIRRLVNGKAVLFIEGFRKELQDEMNKSVEQKEPTLLIERCFKNAEGQLYTLVKNCIQQGIPIVGCESALSQSCGMEEFITFGNNNGSIQQRASIARLVQNYEYAQAIDYAKSTFPDKTWYLSLVGDHHSHSYQSLTNSYEKSHPGIVDIAGGLYISARDESGTISEADFFAEINALGTMNQQSVDDVKKAFFDKEQYTSVANIDQVLKASYTGLNLDLDEINVALKKIYVKYSSPYICITPPQKIDNNLINGYTAEVQSGYLIRAYDPSGLGIISAHEKALPLPLSYEEKLQKCGITGKSILVGIARLLEGSKSNYNPYWMGSSKKGNAIIDAINQLDSNINEAQLQSLVNTPDTLLYNALNIQRITPLTLFGAIGWNNAQSLQMAQHSARQAIF